ncbi:MAG: hypothetical protein RMI56_03320 [Sulfolobales archaeon]|nr:hypothetical protein [Sulfolobales archaeon]MDW8082810.1 hypothetical protein [Sulfolobales archaeon]
MSIERERARILSIWRVESATYNFSVGISTTMAQAYAIKVLDFDLNLLGTMVLIQLGSVGLGYFFGSILVPAFRARRILFWKLFGILNRCLWASIGFTHLLPEQHRVSLFLLNIAVAQLSGSIAGVASGDVGADLVGKERAVKFFGSISSLNMVANSLALATATTFFSFLSEGDSYIASYIVSLVFSIVSSVFLLMLKDLSPSISGRSLREIVADFSDIARNSDYSSYTMIVTVFTFIVNLPGALWNYYLLNVLGGNETWVTLKAIAANLSQSLGFRVWSRVSRIIGLKKTLYTGIILTSPIPVAFTILPTLPGQLALEIYSGFVWAAYHLANNIYTLYLPKRASRVYFIALLNISSNTLASAASRLGASIASISLAAMNAVFTASTIGRIFMSIIAKRAAPDVAVK